MDETLKTLFDNYNLIPLCKNHKIPQKSVSYKQENLTQEQLKKHHQMILNSIGQDINYGLLTGEINNIVVVDFDYKNPDSKDVSIAKKLFDDWSKLTKNPVIIKSHSGGNHLYFKYRPLKNSTNCVKELPNVPIDVRSNGGYIVAPPSKRDGNSYELIKGDLTDIPDMPDEIFNSLKGIDDKTPNKNKNVERISKNMTTLSEMEICEQEYKNASENLPYFEKLMNSLPDYYCENYGDWIRIMIIGSNLYHSSTNKDYVKDVMIRWCKKSTKYQGDEVDNWIERTQYHSTNKLSINSLWDIIKKENSKVFKEIQQEKYIKLYEGFNDLKHTFNSKEFEKISKSDYNSYDICKKYFECYFCFVQNDKSVWTLKPQKTSFCSLSKLKEDFSNLTYQEAQTYTDKEGKEQIRIITIPFIRMWINDINRKQYYDAMVCFNNCPPNILNLFDGFYVDNLEKQGIQPNMENGQKIYDFILKTLFRENQKQGEFVIKWIAQMFQQPKNPTNTCLFLYGDKGCGKSTIFQLISSLTDGGDSIRAVNKNTENKYVYSTAKMRDLFDKFNSKTEDKLCLCLEEAELGNKTGDSKMYAQTIKDAITNRFVNVEKKYKDIKTKFSFSRYLFISNMDTAIHIEDGDRRFVLGECSNDYSQNSKKFTNKQKQDFWNSFYNDLIGDDSSILGFYKLLLQEDININWEHERPNGLLYEKNQRKNKDIFIKYFTTLNIQESNYKTIKGTLYVKYEQNHLISKIKKYYKDKSMKFNKNDFDEEMNKIESRITIGDEPIVKKILNKNSTKSVKETYIIWKHDDLKDWLKENNYTTNNIDDYHNDTLDDDVLNELLKDDENEYDNDEF